MANSSYPYFARYIGSALLDTRAKRRPPPHRVVFWVGTGLAVLLILNNYFAVAMGVLLATVLMGLAVAKYFWVFTKDQFRYRMEEDYLLGLQQGLASGSLESELGPESLSALERCALLASAVGSRTGHFGDSGMSPEEMHLAARESRAAAQALMEAAIGTVRRPVHFKTNPNTEEMGLLADAEAHLKDLQSDLWTTLGKPTLDPNALEAVERVKALRELRCGE